MALLWLTNEGFLGMINKKLAIDLKIMLDPTVMRGWEKPALNKLVADADTVLMTNPIYASIGDVRQAAIVVLKMEGEDDLVDGILKAMIEQHHADSFDPEAIGKLITSSKWGKRKGNVKHAKALSCQLINNTPCSSRAGCGCSK